MKEVIRFLRDLSSNNNREWFNANKDRYKKAQAKWNAFCEELIAEIGKYDEDIAKLTLMPTCWRQATTVMILR